MNQHSRSQRRLHELAQGLALRRSGLAARVLPVEAGLTEGSGLSVVI